MRSVCQHHLATIASAVVLTALGATGSVHADCDPTRIQELLDDQPIGWAAMNGGTTGGQGGPIVTATTAAQLHAFVAQAGPLNILVEGTLVSSNEYLVSSDKTIVGVGNDAAIVGELEIQNAHNVIVRNLFLSHGGSGDFDTIRVRHSTNVWIDHCDIFDGPDGLLDITVQSNFVTVSWNKFYYTQSYAENINVDHRFACLIGGGTSDDAGFLKTTLHHNHWGAYVFRRMPRVRYGDVHVFNEFFNSVDCARVIRAAEQAELLIENNHFEDVHNPFSITHSSAEVVATGNIFINTTGDQHQAGSSFSPDYTYTLDAAEDVKEMVLAGAGAGCLLSTPQGACCFADGSCADLTAADCAGQSGTYQGDLTDCASADCPQPDGACCFVDGSCSTLTAVGCADAGGAYEGDFSDCGGVECPQPEGACCFVDGSCASLTSAECATQSGTYQGDFTDCASANCPQPEGACCFPDESCLELTATDCAAQSGIYVGHFSDCAGTNCAQLTTGACCLLDGTCTIGTIGGCAAIGGTYEGDFTSCGTAQCPQPEGACCFLDGTCASLTSAECAGQDGTFEGHFTECASADCPQPEGACCFIDGTCAELTSDECAAQSGTYQADFTDCASANCPQPEGACCFLDGFCTIRTIGGCAAIGGTYQGDFTSCGPFTCPSSWWDTSFIERLPLRFDNSGQGENLVDFTVLVTLTSSEIDYAKVQDAGQDLRFVDADDATVLDHEIEEWNESGTSYVWVEVPQIDAWSTCDFIYMYYGNDAAPDGQDAAGTWNSGYEAVYHLNDDFLDSTSNNNDGTNNGSADAVGQIADGQDFDGMNDRVDCGDIDAIDNSSYLTYTAWARPSALADWRAVMAKSVNWDSRVGMHLSGDGLGGNNDVLIVFPDNPGSTLGYTNANIISATVWHHWAMVFDGTQTGNRNRLKFYLDGVEQTLTYQGTIPATTPSNTQPLQIASGEGSLYWPGVIDEARVASVARSADWINAQYLSMTDAFISYTLCPPAPEACCFGDGSCSVETPMDCFDAGGFGQGPGTDCGSINCLIEACCFDDGSCSDLLAPECLVQGGTPQGVGSECGSANCPQPEGACCFADGSCSSLTSEECTSQSGTYQGDLSDCGKAQCPPCPREAIAYELVPNADASVLEHEPDWNFNGGQLEVRSLDSPSTPRQNVSYIRFTLPGGADVMAEATLAIQSTADAGSGVRLFGLNDDAAGQNWSETGITYNNAPAINGGDGDPMTQDMDLDDLTLLATIDHGGSDLVEISTPELVDFVNADTDGLMTFLLFAADGSDVGLGYVSREGTGAGPMLSLVEVAPCAADLDGSGDVSFADLLILLTFWGTCVECPADLDCDGMVAFEDLLLMIAAWGPCPG
jgi:pectate lyase